MSKWLKLLDFFGLLDKAISSISTELRASIVEGLIKAREAAKLTDNKMDDIVVGLLCMIFNVPELPK